MLVTDVGDSLFEQIWAACNILKWTSISSLHLTALKLIWYFRNCQSDGSSDGPSGGSRLVAPVSDQSICDIPMTQVELDNCRMVHPMMTVTQCQEWTWSQCQQNQCYAECLAPCDDNDWDCRNPCYETTCNPCQTMCDARCTEVIGDVPAECLQGCFTICNDFNSDHSGKFI